MMPDPLVAIAATPAIAPRNEPRIDDSTLRKASRDLEASFIAEMLKSAGVGKSRDSFGGGAGEDNFSSFLVTAQAEKIVESGGFGLAEKIFQALTRGAQENA